MPASPVLIREETRMLGAMQIMTGVIHYCLGLIWTELLLSQRIVFQKGYIPITILVGYPLWSPIFYISSGTCAVILEKTRSWNMVTYTVVMSIISACIASLGLISLLLEFIIYNGNVRKPIWAQRAGKILSNYVYLFTLLELMVASTVAQWVYHAKRHR
ncbi:membrane-spanning 4-domains subfamily A member 12-like [Dasypus novemcinctus]|uniref:membrane-spanning 4-domains subfamily A member 12-like n=1 Tax=Dasypus novemcinctus TaxID=9361 RepID=UPI0039C9AD6E